MLLFELEWSSRWMRERRRERWDKERRREEREGLFMWVGGGGHISGCF